MPNGLPERTDAQGTQLQLATGLLVAGIVTIAGLMPLALNPLPMQFVGLSG